MIDERRKNNLRNALVNVLSDKQMDNIAKNLELETEVICGKPAADLPCYYVHRGAG